MTYLTSAQGPRVFEQLLRSFNAAAPAGITARWAYLAAAYVLGQQDFALHWASHTTMLRFALQTRDLSEATGQLFRLALIPLGHLLRRLPVGNPGHANVSAFATMPIEAHLSHLIRQAAAATQTRCF